jgi:hypothetical protein
MSVGGSIMGGRKMRLRWLSMVAMVVFGLLVLPPAFARAAAGEGCPNEALRSELSSVGLPDCRAYEMVSPAYKEGYPVLTPNGGSYSANGDEGIVYSLGNLAGAEASAESLEEPEFYSVTRTSAGWQLSALNPPLSQFVVEAPLAEEVDTGLTLWDQHTPLQSTRTNDLYIRSPAEAGSPAKYSMVGPLREAKASNEGEASNVISPEELPSVDATTKNYEHIVLFTEEEAESGGWPSFDHTSVGAPSLYEYSGTGNKQPILVGVIGPKRSESLIRTCGTLLGSGVFRKGSSAYNALSANGEAIFFTVKPCNTAQSAEIYERLHGSIVSKEAASTIDVSESECSGCGAESGKNFEGASENGERVFFTSTQKLTGEAVDGTAGGNAAEAEEGGCSKISAGKGGCNLYEYVSAPGGGRGHLQTVASGEVLGVAGMAEDGGRVYYVSRNDVPGVGKGPRETEPRAGGNNLYVYDTETEKTTFIATLGNEEEEYLVWGKVFGRKPVEVTGSEGQFLLFVTQAQGLVPDDTSAFAQLFEYDAETGELERLTKGENGYNEDGNAVSTGIFRETISEIAQWLGEADYKTTTNRLNISEDGKTVAFDTAGQLSEKAVSAAHDCTSVYEFQTAGKLSEGSVHLVSDGLDVQSDKGFGCGAYFLAMDASGANILFSTADELVPGDTDGTQRDIYDAREDGGFPSPASSAACEGGCEGVVSAPPAFGAPASASLTGSGNLVAPTSTTTTPKATVKKTARCAKGERRSHGKCVKPKIKGKRRKAKRATHGRGSK